MIQLLFDEVVKITGFGAKEVKAVQVWEKVQKKLKWGRGYLDVVLES